MRKKECRYIVGIIALLSLLFFSQNPAHRQKGAEYNPEYLPKTARVERVVDGDTIVIENDLRVRYIGINTPETKHPKRAVEYFGKEASAFNKLLVLGKTVHLEYDVQKFDRYKRLLAYVYVEGVFINARLVEEGYAQVFTVPPNIRYADFFLNLQRSAKEKKKGLWAKTDRTRP